MRQNPIQTCDFYDLIVKLYQQKIVGMDRVEDSIKALIKNKKGKCYIVLSSTQGIDSNCNGNSVTSLGKRMSENKLNSDKQKLSPIRSAKNSSEYFGNNLSGQQWIEQQKKRHKRIEQKLYEKDQIKNMTPHDHVIFISPSSHQEQIKWLKKNGGIFIDRQFPPSLCSLLQNGHKRQQWQRIEWKRATQVFINPKIFKGKIQPRDIKQGSLGNCYFLAVLAALAERPDRIFDLFLEQKLNNNKYYSVQLLYRGKWREIIIDDFFPFQGNKPAFSQSHNQELWVMILEKAWAKIYKSYGKIQSGKPSEALHDLTGAPIKQISLNQNSKSKRNMNEIWEELVDGSLKQYAMIASSNPGKGVQKSRFGIIKGHAYTLLNAVEVMIGKTREKIVKLRNPWGQVENTGIWGDNHPIWNQVSSQEKNRIGFFKAQNDGTFFMSFQDFCSQFRVINIAQIDDDASYVNLSHYDPEGKGAYFTIVVKKPGRYSLQIDKTPERIFTEQQQKIYEYPASQLQISKIQQGKIVKNFETYRSSKKRTNSRWYTLQVGRYVCFVKNYFKKDVEKDFEVNLAVYSEEFCQIFISSREEAKLLHAYADWNGKRQKVPEIPPSPSYISDSSSQYSVKIENTTKNSLQRKIKSEQQVQNDNPQKVRSNMKANFSRDSEQKVNQYDIRSENAIVSSTNSSQRRRNKQIMKITNKIEMYQALENGEYKMRMSQTHQIETKTKTIRQEDGQLKFVEEKTTKIMRDMQNNKDQKNEDVKLTWKTKDGKMFVKIKTKNEVNHECSDQSGSEIPSMVSENEKNKNKLKRNRIQDDQQEYFPKRVRVQGSRPPQDDKDDGDDQARPPGDDQDEDEDDDGDNKRRIKVGSLAPIRKYESQQYDSFGLDLGKRSNSEHPGQFSGLRPKQKTYFDNYTIGSSAKGMLQCDRPPKEEMEEDEQLNKNIKPPFRHI